MPETESLEQNKFNKKFKEKRLTVLCSQPFVA